MEEGDKIVASEEGWQLERHRARKNREIVVKSAEKENEPGLEQTEKFSAKNVGKQNEKELE